MTNLRTASAFDRLVQALEARGATVRSTGRDKASAQCPAHDDTAPSLSVTGIEGQALIHCHAGCQTVDVLAGLEMTMGDLFDTRRGADYRYDNGRTVHRKLDKSFPQSGQSNPPELYRLGRVRAAVAEGRPVFVVEGEKDVHALETLGVTATCAPMGAGKWGKVDPTPLYGGNVLIIADQDGPGRQHAADIAASLREHSTVGIFRPKAGKDAADHVAAGHGINDFISTAQPADVPPALDWQALWADKEPDEFILEPLLPARRAVTIYSAPKVGKSLLMLEIAVAVSRGERVLGNLPDRAHRVLYVDFENDPRGDVRSRLEAMGYGPEHLDQLCYLSFPVIEAFDTAAGGDELMRAVLHYRCDLVVIDTVSRAVAGEENENTTWLGFYRHTGLKLKQAGIALVRLDHSGKDTTKGQRGGSAKSGDVDAVWRLSEVATNTFRLDCEASRLPIAEKVITLTRVTEPHLRHQVDPRAAAGAFDAKVSDAVTRLAELGLPADLGRDTAREALKDAGYQVSTAALAEAIKRRKSPVLNPGGQPVQHELSSEPQDSQRTDDQ